MKNPEGFYPENTGEANAAALQKAVDNNSEIIIDIPGTYDIGDTVYLNSGNALLFCEGVTLRRVKCSSGCDGNAFINKGAFTGVKDKNITIKGLNLVVNGVESIAASEKCSKTIVGLRAHIAFFYIENLTLENITVTGLLHKDYGIQICNFRNAAVDTIYIEGNKDGIHFGPGDGFVLRNGTFRTGDDPIALNADDYAVSNPTLGEIKNGLIENCRDLYEDKNDGFFVRILSGSWGDWFSGMKVRHSDAVIYNNNLYRVVMSPSWEEYTSINPPDFESGFKTIDGIYWAKTGYDKVYSSSVSNIIFRNLYCEKPREAAVSFSIEQNEYRRGYYEGSDFPVNGNFVFDSIQVSADVKHPVIIVSPVESVSIVNSDFGKGSLVISDENQAHLPCPPLKLHLENNSFGRNDITVKNRVVLFE